MALAPALLVAAIAAAPILTVKQTVPVAAAHSDVKWVDARHAIVERRPPEGNLDGWPVTLTWTLFDADTGALTPLALDFAAWARSHAAVLLPATRALHFDTVELVDVDVARGRAFVTIDSRGVGHVRRLFAIWDLAARTLSWTTLLADDVEERAVGVAAIDDLDPLGADPDKRRVLLARRWRSTAEAPECRDPNRWRPLESSPARSARCGVDRLTVLAIDVEARERRELHTLSLRPAVGGPTLFLAPDASRLFVAEWTDGDEPLYGTLLDLTTKTTPVVRARLPGSMSGVAWTRDAFFFGVSQKKSIARVDLRTGAVARFAGWPRLNFVVTPGPDGASILALSDGYRVGVFATDARPPARAREYEALPGVQLFDGARFSPDHRRALVRSDAPDTSKLLLLEVTP